MSKKHTTAALYARTNIAGSQSNAVLASQLETLRAEAHKIGADVVVEIRDVANGASLDRPGLDRLRASAERGDINLVLVCTYDRLTRNLEHQKLLEQEFQQCGVRIHHLA